MHGATQTLHAETPADTLVIGMSTAILLTLDPAEAYEVEALVLIDQLYDKLVELEMVGDQIEVVPEVAASWSVSTDGRTWTFHIREGMHFESGRAITAHDVEFSLRRAVARSSGSSWLLNALGLLPGNVDERVLALDDRRVQIHLSEPFAPNLVLSILAFPITSVVDREFIEQGQGEGTSAESPLKARSAGSGPYRLVQWEPISRWRSWQTTTTGAGLRPCEAFWCITSTRRARK